MTPRWRRPGRCPSKTGASAGKKGEVLIFRLLWVSVQLVWPYLLMPWRSPILRWRMETYGFRGSSGKLLSAGEITPSLFFRFVFTHFGPLVRFLRWASRL